MRNKFALAFVILWGFITIIASGGGGGEDNEDNENDVNELDQVDQVDTGSAPVISNLIYSPQSTIVGAGDGAIPITISMDFFDDDADISAITYIIRDSSTGYEVNNNSEPVSNVSGVISGELETTYFVDTTYSIFPTERKYTLQIYLTDETDLDSNILEGDFDITLGSAPEIANFVWSPLYVEYDSNGGTATITGTFDFIDIDGNADSILIVIVDPNGNVPDPITIDVPDIKGVTSETIEFKFDINTDIKGSYHFGFSLDDENWLSSESLTGNVLVTAAQIF